MGKEEKRDVMTRDAKSVKPQGCTTNIVGTKNKDRMSVRKEKAKKKKKKTITFHQ